MSIGSRLDIIYCPAIVSASTLAAIIRRTKYETLFFQKAIPRLP